MNKVDLFFNKICSLIKDLEKKFYKKKFKNMNNHISLMDFIFFGCNYVSGKSYINSLSKIEYKSDKKLTKQAFNNRRNTFDILILEELNEKIVKYIINEFRNENKNVTLNYCEDSSNLNLSSNLAKDNFKVSKTNEYCSSNLSNLYCQTLKIPVNYYLSNGKVHERCMFMNQIKYLDKGDIIVFDRGYYSKKMVNDLFLLGIKFIFRMKENSDFIKKINKNKNDGYKWIDVKYNNTSIKCKIVKYTIDKNPYYLLTNVFNKSVKELSDFYWERWSCETDFRTIKYNIINNNRIRSKTKKQVELDVKFIFFIDIISSYIANLDRDNNKLNNKKVDLTNCIDLLITYGLSKFLNNNSSIKIEKIKKLTKIIINKKNPVQKNRKFIRKRIFPSSKWTRYGRIFDKNTQKITNDNKNKNNAINEQIIS